MNNKTNKNKKQKHKKFYQKIINKMKIQHEIENNKYKI